ncbi:unnamed protein product [Fraxinus pennsylvanica]|uniref:WAT1-related protein n=1 Tax=Fraxinus pennsylvanica TaxID=56036 RepID=A0AAD1ZKI9_9LAMI|nr:unnamed protein product [Fraxinus pennsylvanica]
MAGGKFLPFLAMVIVQLGYAGMNIISKLAMDSGMNPYVHVAYRQIFASVCLVPFAYFLERTTRPQMTLSILFQIFLCSIFGVTLNQITYLVGLKNSTPTFACALTNINPAVTFVMAIPCKSSVHWKYAEKTGTKDSINHVNLILGPFLLLISAISWAIWLIIQTRVCQQYGAPYSSSAIMCIMASVQCVIVAIGFDHNLSAWSLSQPIRVVSVIYSGIICSAMAFCLMTWCIRKRGSVLIVMGLYGVLWGKNREIEVIVHNIEDQDEERITANEFEITTRNGEITAPNGMEVTETNGMEITVI